MTKQEKIEEIREGIASYLRENDGILCLRVIECESVDCVDCQAVGLMSYLHSQGVVIKVDRDLPKLIDRFRGQVKRVLTQAGYVAVIPIRED